MSDFNEEEEPTKETERVALARAMEQLEQAVDDLKAAIARGR